MKIQRIQFYCRYQAVGTLGYWIKNGEKKIKLLGKEIKVNSKVEAIDGFSAHADYRELIDWADNFKEKPQKIFITHGEEKEANALKQKLEKLEYNCYIPSLYEEIELK
jgi:metallo-beta-lactamase family protein